MLVSLSERLPMDPDDTLRAALWHFDIGRHDRPDVLLAGARTATRMGDAQLAERLAAIVHATAPTIASAVVLVEALVGAGRWEESIAVADPFLDELPWTDEQCALAELRNRALWVGLDRADEAINSWNRGIEAMDDPGLRSRLVAFRDTIAGNVFDSAAVIESASTVLDGPMLDVIAHAQHLIMAVALLSAAGRTGDALERFDRHSPQILAAVEGGAVMNLIGSRVLALAYHGSPQEVIDFLTAVHNDAVKSSDDWTRCGTAEGLCGLFTLTGRPRTACRYAAEFLDLNEATGRMTRADWVAGHYAESLALLGDVEGAARWYERAETLRSRSPRFHHPDIGRMGAWVLAVRGELSAARETAVEAAEMAASRGWRVFQMTALLDAVRFGGRELAPELAEVASQVQGELAHAVKLFADATIRQDASAFDATSEAFESAGRPIQAAEAAALAAALHEAEGRKGSAASAAERSRTLAAGCEGAVTPILASGQRPDPLTRREREVATLAAQGLSNRAIAERLTTSVRTVEGHLYQAYAKLGVSARAELAAALRGD
jgi:DNA-binding NarL/FixJ family response regulator